MDAAGGSDARVERVGLEMVIGPVLDGGEAAGSHGLERALQRWYLPCAVETPPQSRPVDVEDGPLAVGFFEAAQEPEQIPFAGGKRVGDCPGLGSEDG
jgi:hypothetical protein